MRKHFLFFLLLFNFFNLVYLDVNAQFSGVKWQQKILDSVWYRGDYPRGEAIRKVITSKNGEVFLIGRNGWPNQIGLWMDAAIIYKLDKEKNQLWRNTLGMTWYSSDNNAVDVVEAVPTTDGGIVVLTVNPTSVFGSDIMGGGSGGWAEGDVHICKYSSNGNIEWNYDLGGARWDHAFSLDIDRYGDILIAGRTWSATNHFAGIRRSVDTLSMAYKTHGGYTLTNTDTLNFETLNRQYFAMNDAFVAKFNASGKLLKIKCYGGTEADWLVHIKDHPQFGYVAVGYSDSKDLDLPSDGAKSGLWMLNLDTALNIIQSNVLDSNFVDRNFFFVKDNKMYLSSSSRLREVGYNGAVVRDHTTGGVLFNQFSYFDKTGYVYTAADNKRIDIYDSTLQLKDSIKFAGWEYGYFAVDGTNRNNLYLLGMDSKYEFLRWPEGSSDPTYRIFSRSIMNFADQFNFVKGKVFVDANKNNLIDAGEVHLTGIKIEAQKQNSIFIGTTGKEGHVSMPLDTGSYTIKITSPLPYYNIAPTFATIQFANFGVSDSINFALQPIPDKKDLSINLLPLNIARPGFPVQYQLICTNKGTETISNVQVKFLRNPRVSFISSTPAVSSTVADTMIWNIGSFRPFDTAYIHLNMKIAAPPTVNNTDTLLFKSFAFPFAGDETRDDNQSLLSQQVQGSYDPNDKTETHGGIITPEQLAGNDYLTYLIRFQNTGTDTAFNVMIRDTLQNKLDWNSFEMINASHPYYLYMVRPDVLEWNFPNILLVDSNRNEPASHGFVAYRIKPKSTLAVGDTVLNRAHIFFDYNLPVITNDEKTVLRNSLVTSIIEVTNRTGNLLLYPNPSKKLVTVTRKGKLNGVVELRITDINGRIVYAANYGKIVANEFTRQVDILGLPAGFYVLNLRAGTELYSSKLIIK